MFLKRFGVRTMLIASLALAPLTAHQDARAARVTPMVVQMQPSGSGSVARIEVTNDEDREIPVELTMHRGIISETGEVLLEPADERFVVFPPQTVLAPQSQQVFRVQILPDPDQTKSEIYYASVSQLPVALEPTDSRIQMLMRFNVLINVVPPGTEAAPAIDWVKAVEREVPVSGAQAGEEATRLQPGIEVRVTNSGTRYFGAGETSWTISGTNEGGESFSETLTDQAVRESTGLGIVAPDRARIFFIPLAQRVNADTVEIEFN